MPIEIIRFYPAIEHDILALSLRSWTPVFDKMVPAVPEYVYANFYPKGWEVRQTSDIQMFLRSEPENIWVAVDEGVPLGWIGIRLHPEDRMGELYILAVDPKYQRLGIAAALIDYAIAQIRTAGMQMVMVETGDDPGHAPSRAAYENAGFERWPVARYFREI
jgi:GNAT superfamily N-acetyltransferase